MNLSEDAMNKILVLGIGFVFLGSQAVSAFPIKRYGSQPPTDIIINSGSQSLPAPPSPQYPSSPSRQANTALWITVRDSRILSLPYLPFPSCPRWMSKTL